MDRADARQEYGNWIERRSQETVAEGIPEKASAASCAALGFSVAEGMSRALRAERHEAGHSVA